MATLELTLRRRSAAAVEVVCNGRHSHTFDLSTILPADEGQEGPPSPLEEATVYGEHLYQALFPEASPALAALENEPKRVVLVTDDAQLQAVPWEYAYGPQGYLVLDHHFLRGVPHDQRVAAPSEFPELHVVAVPSNPLAESIEPLAIEEEWRRLTEAVDNIPHKLTLERARPPTTGQLRRLVAGQSGRVVHFMGHGGQHEGNRVLFFEAPSGAADPETARDLTRRLGDTTFLVTLNACVSAAPGPTPFSNIAAALVARQIPYVLGMQFVIEDSDAVTLAETFYSDLARDVPVEEAVLQTRLALADSDRAWAIGVPVLYTALGEAGPVFQAQEGTPNIREMQPKPPTDVFAIARAEGAFQGRVAKLLSLGERLTGDERPDLLTIHGAGGQGKTALAREAVERFAHAFPGGIWATSLDGVLAPDAPGKMTPRQRLASDLARFLDVDTEGVLDPAEVEQRLWQRVGQRRFLFVLDNAETLVETVEDDDAQARDLADFLRKLMSEPGISLLATSRRFFDWPGEQQLLLEGLPAQHGARLFQQCAPRRAGDFTVNEAERLSRRVGGHPLSLRLLGGAFNERPGETLAAFSEEVDKYLAQAEDKYRDEEDRHRSLYACMDASVRHLDEELVALLSGLWVFHSPFLPEVAATVFGQQRGPAQPDGDERSAAQDAETKEGRRTSGQESGGDDEDEGRRPPILDLLFALSRRGLLEVERETLREGNVLLFRLLPALRPYCRDYLAQAQEQEALFGRFGAACAAAVDYLHRALARGGLGAYLARQMREDLDRGQQHVGGESLVRYLRDLGRVRYRLGETEAGRALTERALEQAQGRHPRLALQASNSLALIYRATGHPQRALRLLEQVLPITRQVGDRAGEARTLNGMAAVYRITGHPQRALQLYEQTLPITREVGDRAGEAATLNGMALVYQNTGRPQRALQLYEQALPITREVGDRAGEAQNLNNMAGVYQNTGGPQRALQLYEQALPLTREVGDRAGEAATLNNMAGVYQDTGHPQRALRLLEQVLPITRQVGDRAGEARTLNGMATVYQNTGHPQRALRLYEQALPLTREVGDRAGEATTLNNMAGVYRATGRPQRALQLLEEALPLRREVGDRAGQAATLNNMAGVFQATGHPQRALRLYEQALPITREVGDRAGEAKTLHNMAGVYRATGRPQRALQLYEQALSLPREVGDRAGEAKTLNGMALVYRDTGRPQRALQLYEQALSLLREVGDRTGEAATLNGMAYLAMELQRCQVANSHFQASIDLTVQTGHPAGQAAGLVGLATLLYRHLGQPQRAVQRLEEAIAVLEEVGLERDAAGHTQENLRQVLEQMRRGEPLSDKSSKATMPSEQIQTIVSNTVADDVHEEVAQAVRAFLGAEDWASKREVVEERQEALLGEEAEALLAALVEQAEGDGNEDAARFFATHRTLLRDCREQGIEPAFARLQAAQQQARQQDEAQQADLPFPEDLLQRTVAALRRGPQEKMAHAQYLSQLDLDEDDAELQTFLAAIQTALFGGDPAELGQELQGIYAQAWQAIVDNLG